MKRLHKVFIAFLVFVLMIPIVTDRAQARVDVNFVDGKLTFYTVDVAASTPTIYVTTGWIIHRNPRCNSDCTPTNGDYGEVANRQVLQIPNPPVPNQLVTTYFEIPEQQVTSAMLAAGLGDIKDGDTIYLSSVFQVGSRDSNGKVTLKPTKYYSLDAIRDAENWADKSSFRQYYDIQVPYGSGAFPVDIIYMVDGTQVSKNTKGTYKAGEAVHHELDGLITYNGKQYQIKRSYIKTKQPPGPPTFVQNTGDANLTNRNITVSLGGNDIVAEYGIKPPPTPDVPESTSGSDLAPEASAKVRADDRGHEMFDVATGIPTSEDLYANAWTKDYLYSYAFTEKTGVKEYEITFKKTYNLSHTVTITNPDGSTSTDTVDDGSRQVSQTYKIPRTYSYWIISQLQVYKIQKANIRNYALPNGSVDLTPNGYSLPDVDAYHTDDETYHIIPPEYEKVVDLGSQDVSGDGSPPPVPEEDWTSEAESRIGKPKVRNDKLIWSHNGHGTVMSDAPTEEKGPTPGSMKKGNKIGDDVLYRKDLTIEPTKLNKPNEPSTGTIYYDLLESIGTGAPVSYPIPGINTVTVHTPVVNYSYTSDDQAHNQKTDATDGRMAFILDRPFTVTMPTVGQHKDILGYGYRDYKKYIKSKQVYFPFDVWIGGGKDKFVPAGRWIEVPMSQDTLDFFLPVWVDEGFYDVGFREIAINSPTVGFGHQPTYNENLNNYVATHLVPVEVIGRLYDFRITDVADYNWQSVFRRSDGVTPSGAAYWVKDRDIDGAQRGNVDPYMLPILNGSHPDPGYPNVAVKTGYHFKFDVKTKGNMFGKKDGVRITPTFKFVGKQGGRPFPVDLYYHSDSRKFVKIGSEADQEKRYVILDEPLRNVPDDEIYDTAHFKFNRYGPESLNGRSYDQYMTDAFRYATKPSWIGYYDLMILTSPVRTFIGPKEPGLHSVPPGVDVLRANASVQKWYGQYTLPANVYAVRQGVDLPTYARQKGGLDDKDPIFQRNGYIVVNFNLETIRNEDLEYPHLQYIHAEQMNQWRLEGFQNWTEDGYGNDFELADGDVLFYHGDKSSRDDFGSDQTH